MNKNHTTENTSLQRLEESVKYTDRKKDKLKKGTNKQRKKQRN